MTQLFYLLLWAVLMASSFVVSGNMVSYASPLATSSFRFMLALLIMLVILWGRWYNASKRGGDSVASQFKALFQSRGRMGHYVVISGALVGFFVGLFVALQSTTPLHTSVLYTLIPLVGVVIARVWLKEVASWVRVSGFILGSFGAMVVLFSTQGEDDFTWHQGDYIFLGACVLLALHVVSVQKWGRSLGALSGAFMIMLFGSLWLLPITLIWGHLAEVQWYAMGFWVNALYLTVFTTLFTFMLQQKIVMTAGASRLLAFSYTIPIWVVLFTALAQSGFSTLVNLGFLIGLSFIFIALLVIDGKLIARVMYGSNSVAK
ncbi:DMT family transporter [Marinomonas transparens]|uniref:DMT family transporter n=1 Tax=Marinomonas transparens TaxID=2795388 RepID=A0A934N369_9GAMM|nr:DMT family transporter [Marinomonas transparens]MBJ7539422.1 DMT family transporter [Marinomonas transparens]